MIRHCVFLHVRADVPQAEKDGIWADLAALKAVVPGFLALHVGANVSPEGLDKGFSEGFVVDFRDEESRDRYLSDPEHRRTGARIVAAAVDAVEGIFVYDIEIVEPLRAL